MLVVPKVGVCGHQLCPTADKMLSNDASQGSFHRFRHEGVVRTGKMQFRLSRLLLSICSRYVGKIEQRIPYSHAKIALTLPPTHTDLVYIPGWGERGDSHVRTLGTLIVPLREQNLELWYYL